MTTYGVMGGAGDDPDVTPAADERQRGLYGKYRVERIEDRAGKHDDCRYFVLDPQHDPIARKALIVYADQAHRDGYEALANDLYALLWDLR